MPCPPTAAATQAGTVAVETPLAPSCVLIASRNGAAHVGAVIEVAAQQCPVFLVSDASDDQTAAVARAAGAETMELTQNVGKPAALHKALEHFRIADRFETIVVLDDDTTIHPNFIKTCLARMKAGVSVVVGKTESDWRPEVAWNPWVGTRAFAYWRYQLFVRRGQSAFNVMNCISGSNSMYRADLLVELTRRPTPYIVDDTYWTLEIHRRKLGRIVYAPDAVAAVQDPTDLSAWYGQNLRWLWGTMQGIRGHQVGRRASWFDVAYLGVILDWVLFVFLWPLLLVATIAFTDASVVESIGAYLVGYFAWSVVGAVALRRWRLVALFPFLIATDWLYRAVYLHALVKTIRQPVVDDCVWDSPARYSSPTDPLQTNQKAAIQ